MRCSMLFAIPLVLLAVPTGCAQEVTKTAMQDVPAAPAIEKMSPRETAELRADILMARKEFEDAIRAYGKILKEEPKNAELLNKVGVAYQQLTDLRQSEHYYKKAMESDKTFASAVNNIGTVEYERRHYSKAIRYYQKALTFNKDIPTVYSNLGYAYMAHKEYPRAMDCFSKALALDPTIFDRKGGMGSIIQDRTAPDPGLFFFFVAKTFAMAGDAERTAHYLKLARDDGYKDYLSAQKDPSFAKVIKDPRVQEVLLVAPSYAEDSKKPVND